MTFIKIEPKQTLDEYLEEKLIEDIFNCKYQMEALELWVHDEIMTKEEFTVRKHELDLKLFKLENYLDELKEK